MTVIQKLGIRLNTMITAAMVAVGSAIAMPITTTAATLQVTVKDVAPENGIGLAHFWLGFHDGSFDAFNQGQPASGAIKLMAEKQVIGLGARILADFKIPIPQLTNIVIDTYKSGTDYSFISPDLQAALDTGANASTISAILDTTLNSGLDVKQLPPSEGTIAAEFANSPAGKNGGTQDILFLPTLDPIALVQLPGTTATRTIEVGDPQKNRYLSYATMLVPSDDGFIANDDPKAIKIFDDQGNFLGADFYVLGNQAWDAGTAVNNEQTFSNPMIQPVDENGIIQLHPGFKPAGEGGIIDFNSNGLSFANADFSDPSYRIAHITVKEVDEPDNSTSLLVIGGLFLIARKISTFQRRKSKCLT